MSKPFIFILLIFFTIIVKGQTALPANDPVQPFGTVDTADLKMAYCNFEKDANAMVIFDKGDISLMSMA